MFIFNCATIYGKFPMMVDTSWEYPSINIVQRLFFQKTGSTFKARKEKIKPQTEDARLSVQHMFNVSTGSFEIVIDKKGNTTGLQAYWWIRTLRCQILSFNILLVLTRNFLQNLNTYKCTK